MINGNMMRWLGIGLNLGCHYKSGSGSPTNEANSEFKKTSSITEAVSRKNGHIAFMLKAFRSMEKSSKEIPLGTTIA